MRPFTGTHPAAVADWMTGRRGDGRSAVGPRHLRPAHIRLYLSEAIERLTGARLFEYRNYDVV